MKKLTKEQYEAAKTMLRGGVKSQIVADALKLSIHTICRIKNSESYEDHKQKQLDYQRNWKAMDKARKKKALEIVDHPETDDKPEMPGRIETECGMTINDVVFQLVLMNRSLTKLTEAVNAMVEAWKPQEEKGA